MPMPMPTPAPTSDPHPVDSFLRPGVYVDSDSSAVSAFTERVLKGIGSDSVERGIALYYAVRDGLKYDPYGMMVAQDNFIASNIAQRDAAFCIPKAILLTASARAAGIPARLGYADVRNHLCTPKLKAAMQGKDLFIYHGYVEMYLEGRWVKSTPAFNKDLCDKVGIKALEFNGRDDAMLHPFDREGRQHMEYVNDHGTFADHPYECIRDAFNEMYGDLDEMLSRFNGDFATEVTAN
ncbi:MAG: transglutaminase family protein [Porticoccaceae bacterium]|nr:transglutaminase family protein [Porticoccaceae bacterium]